MSSDVLKALTDRMEIVELTAKYCWALDTCSYDALDDVFTADATADLFEDLVGRDAIKARIKRALEPLDGTQHMVSNHVVTITNDTATCRCYLQSQHVRKQESGGSNFIVAGRYEDTLRRTPDGWRITHRVLTTMWTDGNPAVAGGGPRA